MGVMTRLTNILWLPVDLLYLTVDALRIALDKKVYKSVRSNGDQPCIHCKNRDCGYRPRSLPPGIRKYRNRWLGCWLQPCIKTEEKLKDGTRRTCTQDGGFVTYPKGIGLLSLILLGFWICGLYFLIGFIL